MNVVSYESAEFCRRIQDVLVVLVRDCFPIGTLAPGNNDPFNPVVNCLQQILLKKHLSKSLFVRFHKTFRQRPDDCPARPNHLDCPQSLLEHNRRG